MPLEGASLRQVAIAKADKPQEERAIRALGQTFPMVNVISVREQLEAVERQLVQQALERHRHNWAQAARTLEVDASNLHKLARRLCIK